MAFLPGGDEIIVAYNFDDIVIWNSKVSNDILYNYATGEDNVIFNIFWIFYKAFNKFFNWWI